MISMGSPVTNSVLSGAANESVGQSADGIGADPSLRVRHARVGVLLRVHACALLVERVHLSPADFANRSLPPT